MSWIEKLHETYERCAGARQFERDPLLPVSHSTQQAHIEIVLDANGKFLRAKVVAKEETVIPVTEESAWRVGTKPPPHPLSDKVQYCAADYLAFGGTKESFYADYVEQLRRWDKSDHNHKVHAVLSYVEGGTLVADLVRERILWCSEGHKLLTEWTENSAIPELFKMLTPRDGKRDQGDAFIRWRVEVPGELESATWDDPAVRESWIRFDASLHFDSGLCMVTGEDTALAASHPKRLRHGADGAKLISSNDNVGFTFRGRFATPEQAFGVGTIVTQKAHNALRWLVKRQAYHDKASGQVFVAWAIGGQDIPDPFKNTEELLHAAHAVDAIEKGTYSGDAGQQFGVRLEKMIAGYRAQLGESDKVVMMGLDSATPGRMAITFYRELEGSEFLDRILAWHAENSWHQNYAKDRQFIGAPAPTDIAMAAYGRLDDRLRKATVERLLPCIIDGRPLPRDIVESCVRRACNRVGFKKEKTRESEWEKCMGIACALFRGSRKEANYQMSLQEDRTTRDYLFGRLLAIADYAEQQALYVADEKRDSNAAKLMQRFANHPCSAWRNIELALMPYKSRLRANRPGQLVKLEKLLDSVVGMFQSDDFTNDSKLSGEFLLGYHCQRAALWTKQGPSPEPMIKSEEAIQGEES